MMKLLPVFFTVMLTFSTLLSLAQSQTASPADISIDRNGVVLKGKFHTAEGTGFLPTVLLLQGFPGNETDVLGIGKILSQSGINALTFNYSGTFQSQGKSSIPNSEMDIMSAFTFLYNPDNISRFKIDTSFIVLGGYSYGGGMAMTYAIKHSEIKSVFTISGTDWGAYYEEYLRNPEMKKTIDVSMTKLATSSSQIRIEKEAMPDEITKDGIIRLDSAYFLQKNVLRLARKDILIVCGWDDTMATIDQYILPLYRALKKAKAENVQIAALQDGHYFSKTREELAQTILKWVKKVPERNK